MSLELHPLRPEDMPVFKRDMQEAFQQGAAAEFSALEMQVLPEQDIDQSLNAKGSVAYKAVEDGQIVGGVIVVIDAITQNNHLDFLYVKHGIQSRGIGKQIWDAVEKRHADTRTWETVTPYFEKRNIHFYINRCGFSAVEFYNPRHHDPGAPDAMSGGDHFFRLRKAMKSMPINAADAPAAVGGYAQARLLEGPTQWLLISGQIPESVDGVVPVGFEAQAELTWRHVLAQLSAAGMGVQNLVKVTTFLSSREHAQANRQVREQFLGDHRPALTVLIAGIFDEAWLLEIEAIAAA